MKMDLTFEKINSDKKYETLNLPYLYLGTYIELVGLMLATFLYKINFTS